MKGNENDPKGLVFESFQIEGITKSECRSIFLDWALSLPEDKDVGRALRSLLQGYQDANPEHPMIEVIKEGLIGMSAPKRRGGWRARPRN